MQIYKKVLAIVVLVVGFIALVTPLTPGASFLIFLGLQLLGVNLVFLNKIEETLGFPSSRLRANKK